MQSLPLAGRTVVVTRAAAQSQEFVTELERYGAAVISCPTIEISDPESYDQLDEAIDQLYGYDWLIFTSTNGVDFFLKRLAQLKKNVADLDELKVCAVGSATAERLQAAQVHVDVLPSRFKAEGVFEALITFLGGADQMKNLNMLMPRALSGRDVLPRALQNAGARVDVVTAYRTVIPATLDRGKLAAMLTGSADCIAFTSASTVKNLALLFDTNDLSQTLQSLSIACIGDVTAETATQFGLKVDIMPSEFTVAALSAAIADYYR